MNGNEAAALASRGKFNPNLDATSRNTDGLRLGEGIGLAVMGQENWAQYITTSPKLMQPQDKPLDSKATKQLATSRSTGEREGWAFHHADVSVPR